MKSWVRSLRSASLLGLRRACRWLRTSEDASQVGQSRRRQRRTEPVQAVDGAPSRPLPSVPRKPQATEAVEKSAARLRATLAGQWSASTSAAANVKGFDFSVLKQFPKLQRLVLFGAEVNNATLDQIQGLKLRDLVLENTEITDEGLSKLAGTSDAQVAQPAPLVLPDRRRAGIPDQAAEHRATAPAVQPFRQPRHGAPGQDSRSCACSTCAAAVRSATPGLEHLATLKNLERLKLRNPPITDAGLHAIRGLTKLKGLGLEDSRITDDGLADVEGMTKLDELYLMRTNISDKGLEHFEGPQGHEAARAAQRQSRRLGTRVPQGHVRSCRCSTWPKPK